MPQLVCVFSFFFFLFFLLAYLTFLKYEYPIQAAQLHTIAAQGTGLRSDKVPCFLACKTARMGVANIAFAITTPAVGATHCVTTSITTTDTPAGAGAGGAAAPLASCVSLRFALFSFFFSLSVFLPNGVFISNNHEYKITTPLGREHRDYHSAGAGGREREGSGQNDFQTTNKST